MLSFLTSSATSDELIEVAEQLTRLSNNANSAAIIRDWNSAIARGDHSRDNEFNEWLSKAIDDRVPTKTPNNKKTIMIGTAIVSAIALIGAIAIERRMR